MITNKSDLESSKDQIRVSKFIEQFDSALRKKKIIATKPFISLLKDHSKITNASKCSKNQRIINKKHINELFQFLISNSHCELSIKIREFNRASVEFKNKIFTYFASEYPNLMHMVAHDNFKFFQFAQYLHDVDVLVSQWDQYINDIHRGINQASIDLITPIADKNNEDFFPEPFLELTNDPFSYEYNEDESVFQLNQNNPYDDPLLSYI